jgi:hypothetical protein
MHENSLDMRFLTTVFPRLEGEDGYTVLPMYKRMGIGAFVHGQPAPEKRPEDYLSNADREREMRDFIREEKIRHEWCNYYYTHEAEETEEEAS